MKSTEAKSTKRGFVMTGGGAKGLFEAGVIHAFHLCGLEFDVITGSSIGAINSIVYAEYQWLKRHLPAETLADPMKTIEAMDPYVWASLHAWWDLPRMNIIDDSATGPIGLLKDDLLGLDIGLPSIVRLIWWYTDPNNDLVPDLAVLADISRIINELPERLAGGQGVLETWKRWRDDKLNPFDAAVRTYLNRFGMEHALVPDDKADNLRQFFTQSIVPLRREHLDDPAAVLPEIKPVPLIPPDRTLRDYRESGVEVRMTRTNFRTGRLEVSSYNSAEQFAAFLKKHWYRFDNKEGFLPALGNARLQTIGNPNAINAALASGRFPGVFSPMPIDKIYDLTEAEDTANVLFSGLLASWLNDEAVRSALQHPDGDGTEPKVSVSDELLRTWQESEELARLFPRTGDHYVDGGAIDNMPTNSAIDAIKDWIDENNAGNRDVQLDLYTVFLHPPPDPGELVTEMIPSSVETVQRTLEIKNAAVLDSDAAHVRFVNKTAQLAEDTSRTIISLATALEEILAKVPDSPSLQLSEEQKVTLKAAVEAQVSAVLPARKDKDIAGRLAGIKDQYEKIIDEKLPLHVNPIEIHPEEMPMRTLQFTERLGFRKENAVRMITSGCYSTLWSLHEYLSDKLENSPDERDEQALRLAKHWMGLDMAEMPSDKAALRKAWRCSRVECVFHARHCRHGADPAL
ncbi:MAG: patatin-like phospholipase family protein [Candidatus Promineofilum sp.]|nr:patatin-like phospholipase family protein [Promineifilum sp.]